MSDVGDFLLYLFDKDNEDALWSIWLAKDIEDGFADFKKGQLKTIRTKTVSGISDEEVLNNISEASQFIKTKKGG